MQCKHFDECGFIHWLTQFRPNITVGEGNCPKTNGECIRLHPDSKVPIDSPRLESYEETEIANPPFWTDESGHERRV